MNAIILLAELGAVQTLWGPRPRNDSDLIKQLNSGLEADRKSKLFANSVSGPRPKMEASPSSTTIKTQQRHQRLD